MTVAQVLKQTADDLSKSAELLESRADFKSGTPDGIRLAKQALAYHRAAAEIEKLAGRVRG